MKDPVVFVSKSDARASIVAAMHPDLVGYDIDAITDETFKWSVEKDAAGNELADTAGFRQVVTTDEFWEIVDKHKHGKA